MLLSSSSERQREVRGLYLRFTPHEVEFISDKRNQQKQEDYAAESATLALRAQTGIGFWRVSRAWTPRLFLDVGRSAHLKIIAKHEKGFTPAGEICRWEPFGRSCL